MRKGGRLGSDEIWGIMISLNPKPFISLMLFVLHFEAVFKTIFKNLMEVLLDSFM